MGAIPLYLKTNSWGEFVFDWSWADAYHRAGFEYYPKLVSSVPFTPATGPRLLVAETADNDAVSQTLLSGAQQLATELGASSLHLLFPQRAEHRQLVAAGLRLRKDCQFHWHNPGYRDFDDFLDRFSSAKRKKARRERRRIEEYGVTFEALRGDEPTPSEWDAIFHFYARTFLRRGRAPYLGRETFERLRELMPESIVIILGRHGRTPIATAICFRSPSTLYGRYWGALDDFHSMHFETCYYQGIDYCIREGLTRFEPGTQGEHKLSRGFTPVATYSAHWLASKSFSQAVGDFLLRESSYVDDYISELRDRSPFRQGSEPDVIP